MATDIDYIKQMLGFNDSTKDEFLNKIIKRAEDRFLILLKPASAIIPDNLSWIVEEIVIARFNRIGSEGATSETVAGHSITFSDKDFRGFWDDIIAVYPELDNSKKGSIKFY